MAQELKADVLIIDEAKAYQFASQEFSGAMRRMLKIIVEAKEQGVINSVWPVLLKLRQTQFFCTPKLLNTILQMAGENQRFQVK